MEQITKKEFEEIVLNGLVSDIFIAERSYGMFKTIGEKFEDINQSKQYTELFKVTQAAYKDQFLLATARLFDSASDRNKTRCVQGLLKFMSDNSSRLPAIVERSNLIEAMIHSGFENSVLKLVHGGEQDEELAKQIIKHFNDLLTNERNVALLSKLKSLRDKRLAHNELVNDTHIDLVETIEPITFKDLRSLVDIAKNFVGVIGWAYMSMVFVHEGRYHLTADAMRPVNSLITLINNLNANERRNDSD